MHSSVMNPIIIRMSTAVDRNSPYRSMMYTDLLRRSVEDRAKVVDLLRSEGFMLLPVGTKYADLQPTDELLASGTHWKSLADIGGIKALTAPHVEITENHYLWRRPLYRAGGPLAKSAGAPEKTPEEIEKEKQCLFFFGRKPTDQSKLPPPPKVLGMTWDELDDW